MVYQRIVNYRFGHESSSCRRCIRCFFLSSELVLLVSNSAKVHCSDKLRMFVICKLLLSVSILIFPLLHIPPKRMCLLAPPLPLFFFHLPTAKNTTVLHFSRTMTFYRSLSANFRAPCYKDYYHRLERL